MVSLRQFKVPKAPQINITATWLLVVPCLMLGTWLLATMTSTPTPTFRIRTVTPRWNKDKGEGFVGHTAIRNLVGIHYKENEHTTLDFCDTETMPFPYATIQYNTSYRNYHSSFRMMLHHPETDYGVSGSLFNSGGAYEWKSHLKKIMTNFMDELRADGDVLNSLVLDVGANIGSTGLWLASLGYDVHAFEPAARNFALMHCSYVINPELHSRMWLSNVGISDRDLSGVCMKYSQGSQADAFIKTGRHATYEDYYNYPDDAGDEEASSEAQEAILESEMAQEAEENKAVLDDQAAAVNEPKADEAAGRKLMGTRRALEDNTEAIDNAEAAKEAAQETEAELAEEIAVIEEEIAEVEDEIKDTTAVSAELAKATDKIETPEGTEPSVADAVSEEDAYMYDLLPLDDCDEEDVNLITLDWYWEKKLNKQQVTLLKIDVEGYEHKVLKGAKRMFEEKPPLYVLMEVHPGAMRAYQGDPVNLYQSVRDMGYYLIAVDGAEIPKDSWETLVGQQGHLFDTLWVRKQPPESGRFDWGLDYYMEYAYEDGKAGDDKADSNAVPAADSDAAPAADPAGN